MLPKVRGTLKESCSIENMLLNGMSRHRIVMECSTFSDDFVSFGSLVICTLSWM
jgi:hypothetical protein